MRGPLVLAIILILATAAPSGADDAPPIIRAKPAVVEMTADPNRRRLTRLPSLEFPLRIEPRCAPDAHIRWLSISVADTRYNYDASDFDEQPVLDTTLSVPGRQIGPIAIEPFCPYDDPKSDSGVRIPDAITANVSLLCATDAKESMIYESIALEVSLRCKPADDTSDVGDDLEDDQESSSSMTRF